MGICEKSTHYRRKQEIKGREKGQGEGEERRERMGELDDYYELNRSEYKTLKNKEYRIIKMHTKL